MKTDIKNSFTIAFYNLENLFDIHDDPKTADDDFTPKGKKRWDLKRYNRKVKKMGSVISQIGLSDTGMPPVVVGVVEVENLKVLTDLVRTKDLKKHHYGIVHCDSQDERGIDVALLYQKEHFELLSYDTFPLIFINEKGDKDYSRDILLVKGNFKGELTYFIVNHWPSRRKGTEETQPKRIQAAKLAREAITKARLETPEANIIIMGDFNDNPNNVSIKEHLIQGDFHNPFESIHSTGKGTATHDSNWYLFDQIILSNSFFSDKNILSFKRAEIFEEHFLKSWKGKRKGNPFRTFLGKWHQGGFSDHFPVYIELEK